MIYTYLTTEYKPVYYSFALVGDGMGGSLAIGDVPKVHYGASHPSGRGCGSSSIGNGDGYGSYFGDHFGGGYGTGDDTITISARRRKL